MIKAVLFDYGGVLTEGGKVGGISTTLAALTGLPAETINMSDLHAQYIRGLMSEQEFFAELNRRYGGARSITADDFNNASDIFVKAQPVYDLAARLRAHGIATGILSNMYDMSARKLRELGRYADFSPVILSCEEHLAKPDRAFFELAIKRLGIPAEQILFIDDQERFKHIAEGLGMHFLRADNTAQIVADVTRIIEKANGITL